MSKFLATTALAATMLGAIFVSAPAEAHYHRYHYRHYAHYHHRYHVALIPDGIQGLVTRIAAEEGIPTRLAHALIRVESGYNCSARNASGAAGIGQLTRGTARALGVTNPFNCAQNLRGSMRYLRMGIARFGLGCGGISSYNSGLGSGRCTAYGRKILRMASAG